jgi:CheY-like chemotaxis protein
MVLDRSSSPAGRSLTTPRHTVLVLEDDLDVSQTIGELIEDQGYRAICVGNGREALAVLEHERPCLMLIDVFMPIMNGVEFLRVVKTRAALADIPRVLMTAANDRMIGVKEDVSVLYKPVDFDALKRMLEKYCVSTPTPPTMPPTPTSPHSR